MAATYRENEQIKRYTIDLKEQLDESNELYAKTGIKSVLVR